MHRLEVAPSGHRLPLWHIGALAGLLLMLGIAWVGYERPSANEPAMETVTTQLPIEPSAAATRVPIPQVAAVDERNDEAGAEVISVPPTAIAEPRVRDIAAEQQLAEAAPAKPAPPTPVDDPLMHTGTRSPVPPAASTHTADERHLLARAANRYTLQVLAAGSSAGVEEFVARHAAQPLRVYRTQRNGQPWHVVVLGDFSSSAEARAAIQSLPKTLQKSGPWPRDMASVQQQINQQS